EHFWPWIANFGPFRFKFDRSAGDSVYFQPFKPCSNVDADFWPSVLLIGPAQVRALVFAMLHVDNFVFYQTNLTSTASIPFASGGSLILEAGEAYLRVDGDSNEVPAYDGARSIYFVDC